MGGSFLYTVYATSMITPYLFLFYGTWIALSLARPLLVLTVIAVLSKPGAAHRKFEIFITTVKFLVLSKDKKFKAPKTDPGSYFENKESKDIDKKTIVFVRHGESTWNDTFNKGDRKTLAFIQGFLPGLVKAIFMEWYFWVTGQENESWFYDAPLSPKGLKQAQTIHEYLTNAKVDFMPHKEKEILKILLGPDGSGENITGGVGLPTSTAHKSQLVSSNLRRAISTMAVGFSTRLKRGRDTDQMEEDQIMLLPELQEISFNPDALCITPPFTAPTIAWTDPKTIKKTYEQRINVKLHTGNKDIDKNGLHRLQAFCRLVFDESAIPSTKSSVICAGHSLWFRSFFQTYLPYTFEHVAKEKKLQNGGIVAFSLLRTKSSGEGTDEEYHYMIDPKSIVIVHGGF